MKTLAIAFSQSGLSLKFAAFAPVVVTEASAITRSESQLFSKWWVHTWQSRRRDVATDARRKTLTEIGGILAR
jgi:hypothetical protein